MKMKTIISQLSFLCCIIAFFGFNCNRNNYQNSDYNHLWIILDNDSNYYEYYIDSSKQFFFFGELGYVSSIYSGELEQFCKSNEKPYITWKMDLIDCKNLEEERQVVIKMLDFFNLEKNFANGILLIEPIEGVKYEKSDNCCEDENTFLSEAMYRAREFYGNPSNGAVIEIVDTMQVIEKE